MNSCAICARILLPKAARPSKKAATKRPPEIVINAMEVGPQQHRGPLARRAPCAARGAVGEALEHAQRSASLAEATGNVQHAIEITRDTLLQLLARG
jgi:hypothetical protein